MRFEGRFGTLAMLMTSAMPLALTATPACAQDVATTDARIELPAQPLAETLRAIGGATRTQVRFDPQVIAPIAARAVRADSAEQALAQAVAGTSLRVSGTAVNGFYVGPVGAVVADDGDIVVVAQRDEAELRYLVRTTASSTRDGRTLREQPQAATVIGNRLIRDQQVQTIAEALRNAAGATVNLGNVQGAPSYTVRGFFAQPLTGGLRDPGGLSQPVANVERVEVLKGPAAVLAGADNLGGSVNIVTKKPVASPLLDLTAEYGSFDDRRFAADGSTALDPDRRVSARLVLQHARADRNAGGYDGRFENFVAPSIRYKDETLDVTAGIDFSDVRSPAAPYGAFDFSRTLVDLSADPVGPSDQGFRLENRRFHYDAQWQAAPWLTLVSRTHRSETDTRLKIFGLAANLAPNLSLFLKNDELQKSRTWATDTYARLQFGTGPVAHRLVLGVNYSDLKLDSFVPADSEGIAVVDAFGAGNPAVPFSAFRDPDTFNAGSTARQYGYVVQELIEYGPIHVTGALRFNRFISTSQVPGFADSRDRVSATTPQAGVVVDLSPRISIYGNYIRGFIPNFLLGTDNRLLPPRRSRNIEGGVKWDIAPDRLALTASVFRIAETNIPINVVGVRNRYTTIDGQVSKGVETDLTGELAPGWDIAASYSYATFDVQNPTPAFAEIPGQPEHKYSLFSRYTLERGVLRNLGLGAGVYGFSRSYVDRIGTLRLPSQVRVDANLYYKVGRISANLGVTNLLDDDVYGVTQTPTYVPITPKRTFRLTLTYNSF